jgi:hypothetical protein
VAVNEQQFLKMEDRERDAWIAEHIMGWTSIRYAEHGYWCLMGVPPGRTGEEQVDSYSTDYNAIHRVDSLMWEKGWYLTLSRVKDGKWHASYVRRFLEGEHFLAENTDPILAVATAAGRATASIE